jgi:hypothetical protein
LRGRHAAHAAAGDISDDSWIEFAAGRGCRLPRSGQVAGSDPASAVAVNGTAVILHPAGRVLGRCWPCAACGCSEPHGGCAVVDALPGTLMANVCGTGVTKYDRQKVGVTTWLWLPALRPSSALNAALWGAAQWWVLLVYSAGCGLRCTLLHLRLTTYCGNTSSSNAWGNSI